MKQLRKFVHLTSSDYQLLLGTVFLLGTIRLGLWLLPFPTLRRLLAKMTQTAKESQTQIPLGRIVWAVAAASRYMPGEVKCLARALATQILLARQGYQAQLCLGVAKGEGGLEAHAWVESQGKIVMGGIKNLGRYTPLPTLEVNS